MTLRLQSNCWKLLGFPVDPLIVVRISAKVFSIILLLQNIFRRISLILQWMNIYLLRWILIFRLMLLWMLLLPFFIHLEHLKFFLFLSSNFRFNFLLSIVLLIRLRIVNFIMLFLNEFLIILIDILVIL